MYMCMMLMSTTGAEPQGGCEGPHPGALLHLCYSQFEAAWVTDTNAVAVTVNSVFIQPSGFCRLQSWKKITCFSTCHHQDGLAHV